MSSAQDRGGRAEAARKFVDQWSNRGEEKSDTHSYWLQLCHDVLGMPDVTKNVHFEARTPLNGWIDVLIPDAKVLVEMKSANIDLDRPEERQGTMVTPYEQAKRYADSLPNSQRPDTIIVSNFQTMRLHDLNSTRPDVTFIELPLVELPARSHELDFLADPLATRRQVEQQASMQAGALIGRLYDALRGQYLDPDSPENQHALNVLCTRLVFCLFAEDSEIFPKNAFGDYLRTLNTAGTRAGLKALFAWLDATPENRDPYASEALTRFPYVNGGLFRGEYEIPPFTDEIRDMLLEEVSEGTDWSAISPTIFGGVFESTLNPQTRRAGGMHYTSPENIHKVIDPLFLDDLSAQLDGILADTSVKVSTRKHRLKKYHDKIASLQFLDPAAGSGNFLAETYMTLRRLENTVVTELQNLTSGGQTELATEEASPLKVSLRQFHGIEINDFAVQVANTSLWIAELKANAEAATIITAAIEDLPLKDKANVVQGNALRLDWNDVLPASRCSYIMGNPPFIGQYLRSKEQTADLEAVWGHQYNGYLDYVTGWHKKAVNYAENTGTPFAFVSTNSIAQGQPVEALFAPLFHAGWRIRFAHQTFVWRNEGTNPAAVHCVIVGLDKQKNEPATLFTAEGDGDVVPNINAYLAPAENLFIEKRSKPLSPSVPPVSYGSKPADNGGFSVSPEEYVELDKDKTIHRYLRQFVGARELLHGTDRWCLWLTNATPNDIAKSPTLQERLTIVKEFRLASRKRATRELADSPHLFVENRQPEVSYLCIPRHVSETRDYFTAQRFPADVISSDANFTAPDPDGYLFAIISSSMFITWQRAVGGRIKSDLRFSNTVVWNNLPLPQVNDSLHQKIIEAGQGVLNAREKYPDSSLADLYHPLAMPPELRKAHRSLDRVVDLAFGAEHPLNSNEERLAHLFQRYAEMTS